MGSLSAEHYVKIAEEYGLSTDEVQMAAIAAMLTRKDVSGKKSLHQLFTNLSKILGPDELVNVIKWGTWVKHATQKGLKGTSVGELLDLQKTNAHA